MSSVQTELVLKSDILQDGGRSVAILLSLTTTHFIISFETVVKKPVEIPFRYILGCSSEMTEDNTLKTNGVKGLVKINYLHVSRSNRDGKNFKRRDLRQIILLRKDDEEWKSFINAAMMRNRILTQIVALTCCKISGDNISRKVLVFINPNSGTGKSLQIYNTQVLPLLCAANIECEIIITRGQNDARNHIKTLDVVKRQDLLGIVVLSGDGIVHEICNGLFYHGSEALHIPISIIPTGSGNGLAKSISHVNDEIFSVKDVTSSVLNLVCGKKRNLNVFSVYTETEIIYGVLSISWGLFADCDIESECAKFLGEFRFTVWGIFNWFRHRTYYGTLQYLEAKNDDWVTIRDHFRTVFCSNIPWVGSNLYISPKSKVDDGILWLLIIRARATRHQVLRVLLNLNTGEHVNLRGIKMVPVTQVKLELLDTASNRIVIDGEPTNYSKIHVKMVPSTLSIFSKN